MLGDMFCWAAGSVRIYDYEMKQYLCLAKFNCPGTSLLWLPQTVSIQQHRLRKSSVCIIVCIVPRITNVSTTVGLTSLF